MPEQILELVENCPREINNVSQHIMEVPQKHRKRGKIEVLDPKSKDYELFNSRILYNSLNIELQELAKLRIPLHMLYTRYEAPHKEKL